MINPSIAEQARIARAAGLSRFMPTTPCKPRGHLSERYAAGTGNCIACARETARLRGDKRKARAHRAGLINIKEKTTRAVT